MQKIEKIKATLRALGNGVTEYTPGCGLYRFLVIKSILKTKGIKAQNAISSQVDLWLNEYDEKAAEREDERMVEKPDMSIFSLKELLAEIKKRGVIVNGSLQMVQKIDY